MIRKGDLIDFDAATGRMHSTPRQIFLEITSRCNLACVHCSKDYGSDAGHPELDLPLETIHKLLPWIADAESVNLNIVGEPLVAHHFQEILALTTQVSRRVCFNTNGVLLDREVCELLVQRQAFSIAVSVDGIESNWVLRGVDYQQLKSRILALDAAKRAARTERPEIALAFTLMNRNADELPRLLEDLLPTGAIQAVHVQPLVVFYEGLRGENVYSRTDIDALVKRCHAIADGYQVPLMLFRSSFVHDERSGRHAQEIPLGQVSKRFGCIDPFFEIKIRSNGDVMSCSNGRHGGLNVNAMTLDALWNAPWYRQLRLDLTAGRFLDECARCPCVHGSRTNQESHLRPGVHHSHEWRLRRGASPDEAAPEPEESLPEETPLVPGPQSPGA
ncbi:MAG: radical SAM protein [Planctomycetota bacterium]